MRIVVAPDKFKGSLGAQAVAAAIAAGLRSELPDAEIEMVPVADGGEGTAEVISNARGGEWKRCRVHDPLGRAIEARFLWLPDSSTAVLEMSEAAGIRHLSPNERDPTAASTFGVGEMLLSAAAEGASGILLGLGGSATNDGGTGMARALGFRFFSTEKEIEWPADLDRLSRIEKPDRLHLPNITAACDVRNPLLGAGGATRVFGPQKGATADQVELLETAMARLALVVERDLACNAAASPGSGAAGGLGFGLRAFCHASVQPGFEIVAQAIDLRARLAGADYVITGEGQLDHQTLEGKAPAGVAKLARELGKPVFALVGCARNHVDVGSLFDQVLEVRDPSPGFRETAPRLERQARILARLLRGKQCRSRFPAGE